MTRCIEQLDNGYSATNNLRFFTIEQANRSLVLLKRIVTDIIDDYSRLLDLQEIIEIAEFDGDIDKCESTQDEIVEIADKLHLYIEELDTIGVELTDWTDGVVDFPFVIDGREIRLCWKYGENQVNHWREFGADFTARQPLETLVTSKVAAV